MTFSAERESRHYSRAPILEALLEILVHPLSEDKLATLDLLWNEIRDQYPARDARRQVTAQIMVGPEVGAAATHRNDGFVYRTADEKQRLQVHLGGFAFHRLTPYESWESFRDEARRLWNAYSAAVDKPLVARVGVRYINQLTVPSEDDLSRYLRVYPLTDSISKYLAGYGMNVQIPIDSMNGGMLFLQQALLPRDVPEISKILLDLALQFPREDNIDLWEQFEKIRPIKNRIFDDCVTAEMKERLK